MRPPHIDNVTQDIKSIIDFAVQSGVKHIVFLSLLGADKNKMMPQAKIEDLLLASPISYTLLRCGFFMQNLSTMHRQDIKENNDIFIPAGKGKTAFIDTRDIATIAVKALTEPGHKQKAYSLTGQETLGYNEVAALMSIVLGRKTTYSSPSLLRFAWRFWQRGYSLRHVGIVSSIYATTNLGLAEKVTPQAARLLGRPPISMQQFIQDYAAAWQ